jgi:hypothetical protein
MKMSVINGVIIVYGDQTEARNIKKVYTSGQKNVHVIVKEEKKKKKMQSLKPKLKHVKKQKEYLLIR